MEISRYILYHHFPYVIELLSVLIVPSISERLFSTVGCHPTRCNEFEESGDPESYLKSLSDLATDNKDKIVAIGEMGLDYDRLQFCSKDIQKKYFEMQLSLCSTLKLPMFLHCRNASEDFVRILRKHKDTLTAGVVHSFDGNPEEANSILQMGLYIGINGWYVKSIALLRVRKF